jgi:hypothetical protein
MSCPEIHPMVPDEKFHWSDVRYVKTMELAPGHSIIWEFVSEEEPHSKVE